MISAAFSWIGLMHSAVLRWKAEPMYAAGWLVAGVTVYSARWWGGGPAHERTGAGNESHV